MSDPVIAAQPARASPAGIQGLRCRVRVADGRVFSGDLVPGRHRALQLGLLHADSDGLVELAAGARRDGNLQISTRSRPDHFLPGGNTRQDSWLQALLALAQTHVNRGEEVFLAPAVRTQPRGDRHAVSHTRALWVDVDQPGQLQHLWAFLAERPCHLLVESGSGGVHAYWRLDQPLAATRLIERTGELLEPIEQAHRRIIHHLGVDRTGKPNVADPQVKDRSRVMRLSGTVNRKNGRYARIVEADFQLAGYAVEQLVGDLPDPTPSTADCGVREAKGRSRGPVQADLAAGVLRSARGGDGPAGRTGAVPRHLARRRASLVQRRRGRQHRLEMPQRIVRGAAARSTTSPRCCSAGHGAASCEASSSNARAPMSPTRSASSPDEQQPAKEQQR